VELHDVRALAEAMGRALIDEGKRREEKAFTAGGEVLLGEGSTGDIGGLSVGGIGKSQSDLELTG